MSGQDIHLQYKWPWLETSACVLNYFLRVNGFRLVCGFPTALTWRGSSRSSDLKVEIQERKKRKRERETVRRKLNV